MQLQESAADNDQREALLNKYFAAGERVTVQLTLMRERDIGSEMGFYSVLKRSPLATPDPNPVEAIAAARAWWQELDQHVATRE